MTSQSPRVLLVRLSALGDILHTLPALAALRRARPEAFIGWVVEEAGAQLLEGHPDIDALHVMPRRAWRENPLKAALGPMRELIRQVRSRDYDMAIDFQGLTKSALWTRLSGARERVGFRGQDARELSRFFYNRPIYPRAQEIHVIQRNLALLRPLGVENPEVQFRVRLPEAARLKAEAIWGPEDERYPRVVMNPGAGWPTKLWSAAAYGRLAAELISEIGARVALAWGPGEEGLVKTALEAAGKVGAEVGRRSEEAIAPEPGVHSLAPTSFVELGAVIERAHLLVAGDTGPVHFAAALGVPTLGLYGASDSKRNGPWGERSRAIQLTDPPCIPCWRTWCDWEEPLACLTHIAVGRVTAECLKLLEG